MNEAMQRYKAYMQEEKGNKPLSVSTTSHAVAMALGHGSAEVTRRHYIRSGTAEQAGRARLEQLIELPAAEPAAELMGGAGHE